MSARGAAATPPRRTMLRRWLTSLPPLLLLILLLQLCRPAHGQQQQQQQQQQQPRPAASLCAKRPFAGAARPSAMARAGGGGGNLLKLYRNLYLHGGRFYALLGPDSNASEIDAGMSLNFDVVALPAADARALKAAMGAARGACHVPGVTLHVDFPFPGYPDNLGHWAEVMYPTFSAFATPGWGDAILEDARGGGEGDDGADADEEGSSSSSSMGGGAEQQEQERRRRRRSGQQQRQQPYVRRVLLGNVPAHMLDWMREVLAIALAPAAAPPAPPAADGSGGGGEQQQQRHPPPPPLVEAAALESYSKSRWILFEWVAVVQDRYPLLHQLAREPWLEAARARAPAPHVMGPLRTGFAAPELAAAFRKAAHARAGWPEDWREAAADRAAARRRAAAEKGAAAAAAEEGGGAGAGGACAAGQGECSGAGGGSGSGGGRGGAAEAAAAGPPGIPRVITVMLDPDDYPQITNHHALVARLEDVAAPFGFEVRFDGGFVAAAAGADAGGGGLRRRAGRGGARAAQE